MKRNILLLSIILTFSSGVFGQFGLSAGPSLIKTFGSPKALMGLHFGGEMSQDDETSYFGRISYAPGSTESTVNNIQLVPNSLSNPNYPTIGFTTKTAFTTIEGGVRYYLGDGYETGLSIYGGTKFVLGFNKIKARYDAYDENLYRLPDGATAFGTVVGFGFGLQGGVKYGITGIGTVYFDLGLNYMLTQTASNAMYSYSSYLLQPIFAFNLGFRKDLYIER